MSGWIDILNRIASECFSWWSLIVIDGTPLLTWMFALWAFGLVITAIHAFAGLGFPSVSGSLMPHVEAARYYRPRSRGERVAARDARIRRDKLYTDEYWENRDAE